MWGAVIGDIVGSRHEFAHPAKTKDFEFWRDDCHVTDDSVLTAAVADLLLNDRPVAETLQAWCRDHFGVRYSYGTMFSFWIFQDSPGPYGSFGNGAGMRVSPAAFLNRNSLEAALAASDKVTEVTHDHPEGMKGARATTHAIWMAFAGEEPTEIRKAVAETYDYDLSRSVDEIRPGYEYDETCRRTVPEAITCALESSSLEDAIRNAVSLGGDADTLAAIAGAVAEGLHGMPEEMIGKAKSYLDDAPRIREVMEKMYGS